MYLLTGLVSLLITLYLVLMDPRIQTLAARAASAWLSQKMGTEIRIGGFNLSFSKGLLINDILVRDHRDTVMFSAHTLGVRPGVIHLKRHILNIGKVTVDQGVFQLLTHKGDSALNLQRFIDFFASKEPDTDTVPAAKWYLSVSSVDISDTRFHFQDENAVPEPAGMDYANIDARHINLQLTDFFPLGDTLRAKIRHLSAQERSGLTLNDFSGEFSVCSAFLKAHALRIKTVKNDLDLDFEFHYDAWTAYNDFLEKVRIQAKIRPSTFNLEEVGAFAPVLYAMTNPYRIEGDVKGTVSNFKAKNFRIGFGNGSEFFGNINAAGLPDVEETFVDLNIKNLAVDRQDVEAIRLPIDAGHVTLPEMLGNAGKIRMEGTFTGFFNDFAANLLVKTDIGQLAADLVLRSKKEGRISYEGMLKAGGFDIGKMTGIGPMIGPATLRADLKGSGLTLNDADLQANLHIDSVYLNRYMYHQVSLEGVLKEKKFNGALGVTDPNLVLDFLGLIDLQDSLPAFRFHSTIQHAQLARLHLLERDSVSDLSARLNVDFTGNDIDNIDGKIVIDQFTYLEGQNVIPMENLTLQTSLDDTGNKSYHLTSDYVDADFTGHFNFRDMIPSLSGFINNYLASFSLKDSLIAHRPHTDQVLKYRVFLKNTDAVTAVFASFLQVAPSTVLSGSYDETREVISLEGHSANIVIGGLDMKDWAIEATSRPDILEVETGCRSFVIREGVSGDSSSIRMDTLLLKSALRQDSILFTLGWRNPGGASRVGGFMSFRESPSYQIAFRDFSVMIDRKYWTLDPANSIRIDTNRITLSKLRFRSGDQILGAEGKISGDELDTLVCDFNNIDISRLDYLAGNPDLNIDGILSGRVKLNNIYKSVSLLGDLRIAKFRMNREMMGDIDFNVKYDAAKEQFNVASRIIYTGNVGTNIPFDLKGSVHTGGKSPDLDLTLDLNNLNLKIVQPFVSGFMSGLSGFASGHARIKGTLKDPILTGEINLMRTEMRLSFLNVGYSLADVVKIDTGAFLFNRITLYDSLGHKAYLNGRITHHSFQDLALDLNIECVDFSAFKNSPAQNSIFYGTARASGNVSVTGPIDNISIAVKASTGGGTHVVIPINTTADVGQSDYIIFDEVKTDSADKGPRMMRGEAKGLSLNLAMLVKPDADLEVYLPDQMGNIRASGSGDLTMAMSPTADFSLLGTYTLQKGSFVFSLKNLLRLNFSIQDGSRIAWSGDPTDANVSLSAIYKTRVTLSGLTTDPDLVSQRIPVECVIRLGGQLMNPDISFGLNLPNAAENVKAIVYGAIDTNNIPQMNEQMIYILVMNQFKPSTGIGIEQFDAGATSLSMLANQVSGWLSKISQNVNVGVNYKAATNSETRSEFDVSLSTQLFNDRLLIDGLFGMTSGTSSSTVQQASTIVGDINIEYVLTKNRRWRVRAFNRTNTVDQINNNAPYTQGVGLSYQRDFNKFGDLFKNPKKEKKTTTPKN